MGPEIMETLAPLSSPGHLKVSLRKSLQVPEIGHGWASYFPLFPSPGQALLMYAQGLGLVFNWEICTFRYFLQHLQYSRVCTAHQKAGADCSAWSCEQRAFRNPFPFFCWLLLP